MEIESKTTILDLNMDVLDIIFSNFYWEKDKLNFAKAHKHLSAAFVHHSRKQYKEICTLDTDWPFILEWFGTKVLSLKDESYQYDNFNQTNQMLELAAKYCPNVEAIEFLISEENMMIIENNLEKLKNLNYVILNGKPPSINIKNIFEILKQLPKLRRIAVYNWSISYLAPMNNLEYIEHLEFSDLDEDDISVLSNLWKNLKCLRTHAYPSTLNLLAKHCTQLEYLRLWAYNDCEKSMFPYFPKLKRLKIFSCDEYNDNGAYFQTLHGKYNSQLETLEFPKGYIDTAKTAKRIAKLKAVKTLCCQYMESRCIRYIARMPLEKLIMHKLEENDLLILLRECKTLRLLHLDRLKLEKDSLYTLLDILKSNGFQPENPFVLCLDCKQLRASIIQKLTLCSNRTLLDIQEASFNLSCRY
ncbi:uncharacterized protein LOC117787361 isoform X1 [Drosophila innubila]|uniref:uncharacterized protein LOC117787361 isoform X1 n=1 Tax=Drosophila innubila TaxID=198719 RepID=UPI00148C4B74|nr:uncharacterized protein LOC117787361 isoform X1 [Drosophila innubila]